MRYQTLNSKVVNTFKKLGGQWALMNSIPGISLYKDNKGSYLYVFDNESIKGFNDKRYGIVVNN